MFLSFSSSYFVITALIIALNHNSVESYVVDDSKDLVITYDEKVALDKLKSQILDVLPEDYMRSDFYLIRWIRTAEMDVSLAKSMLLKNLQWRVKNNISRIIYEDWSDMEQDYHVTSDGRDREGRPFGTLDFGEWDLVGAVVSGKKPRLQRYLTFLLEKGILDLLKAQRDSAKPITRGTIIIDGDGGNIRNLCPACISIIFQWIREMEMYYPKFIREIIVINAPSITQMALKAVRPAMSKETNDIIHIFNTNKKLWMEYLDRKIDRNQRTPRYGGTRKEINY